MSSQKIKYFEGFKYCFFTRNGGVSNKNFSSLNCAFNEEENPKNVIKNREIVKTKFSRSKKLILLNQIHSNKVIFLNKKIPKVIIADGVVTNRKDLCLGILTADCCPIFIFEKSNKYICALHSGWKGALKNISAKGINYFVNQKIDKKNIIVLIGPCVGIKIFELSKYFKKKFINKNKKYFIFFK